MDKFLATKQKLVTRSFSLFGLRTSIEGKANGIQRDKNSGFCSHRNLPSRVATEVFRSGTHFPIVFAPRKTLLIINILFAPQIRFPNCVPV